MKTNLLGRIGKSTMEELFAPDSAGDDDAAAAPAPAVADPVDTLVGGGAADDDLGALTSTSSGGAAAAEEDGIVAQEAGAATSSAPVVQDDAVVDDYSMPVPVQVQVDPDRTARMVVSSPFSWVSLNPGKRCKIALSLSLFFFLILCSFFIPFDNTLEVGVRRLDSGTTACPPSQR